MSITEVLDVLQSAGFIVFVIVGGSFLIDFIRTDRLYRKELDDLDELRYRIDSIEYHLNHSNVKEKD